MPVFLHQALAREETARQEDEANPPLQEPAIEQAMERRAAPAC